MRHLRKSRHRRCRLLEHPSDRVSPRPDRTGKAVAVTADETLIDRELSWLSFNERVLRLAADTSVPLLERVKFCAIFGTNLDEFFEVRVAGLQDQLDSLVAAGSNDRRTTLASLNDIASEVTRLSGVQHLALDAIITDLADHHIEIVPVASLDTEELASARTTYGDLIYPVLTPLAVDPGHPFPYISNLSLNLAVTIRDPDTERQLFARVKVPPSLARFVQVGSGERFVRIEDLIASEIGTLFPGLVVESTHVFRVTRDADIDLDGSDADDLLVEVESKLRRRRFGTAVRLEIDAHAPASLIELLLDELDLGPRDVSRAEGWLGLRDLWSLAQLDRADLRYEQWTPVTAERLSGPGAADMFAVIRNGDVMVHHPYESFSSSVERFIAEAAADAQVLAIKLTLYRTSGDGQIVESLIRAVAAGKQVAVLIEVTARFDELANIAWARKLEEAGVHVVYGVVGFKTHTKVALVIRGEADGLRRYCHVATGNYNATTARVYEDISLFSCDASLGDDLAKLFNNLTGYGTPSSYQRLLVAPSRLRPQMLELIANEFPTSERGPGRIVMKMNSLVDPEMISALYDASAAGVSIDLIIRGICCLRPGKAGLSDNIRVRSIVGRYLEHSRIYHFANGSGMDRSSWLLGSADLMQRNLDHRVEAVVDVLDPILIARLRRLIELQLHPELACWTLDADGTWTRSPAQRSTAIDLHQSLQLLASIRSSPD